ncbi:MAG: amino acid permease [Solirubrobacterales bacterium]|nr:amino acid permease [Solirubrobacterales bacterium]
MRPSPRLASVHPRVVDDVRRVLVVANETVGGELLHELLVAVTGGGRETRVLVLVPALHDRLLQLPPHLSGQGGNGGAGARAATARLEACLAQLDAEGIEATGRLADVDPMLAMTQALREFPADQVIIATHPVHRSNWLAHDLVARADRAFGLPIAHVVVDDAPVGAPG